MDAVYSNEIKNLLQTSEGMHVSITMPAHHKGGADQQDLIRFKNHLRSAEEKLLQKGLRLPDVRSIIKPAEPLLTDSLFWRQQGDGLAIFLAGNSLRYYRLPMAPEEMVEVGKRYFIRPLISLLSQCGVFHVLAVSLNEIRLMQCTSTGAVRLDPPDLPAGITETLHLRTSSDSVSRPHTGIQAGISKAGAPAQPEMSGSVSVDEEQIMQYLEQINGSIAGMLKFEQSPLVFAGADFLHPLYRKVNTYPHLLNKGIIGLPDGSSDAVLRQLAWPLVKGQFEKVRNEALAEYRKAAGTGLTADQAGDVVTASIHGRIRFLFISEGAYYRGRVPAGIDLTAISGSQEGDEDLVDLAVYHTLKYAGAVFVVEPQEMSPDAVMLGLFRY
ncbi:MAG: hypothetical protein JXA46_18005 [Dehalococcoidales bacterium]|nr:hypothetical protein [Dehalococcoidales bacterium]